MSTSGPPVQHDLFESLSTVLTGFSATELRGTGMVEEFEAELLRTIGSREVAALLSAFERVGGEDEDAFRRAIWDHERFGPVVRCLVGLWYLGVWQQLPAAWRSAHGAMSYDTDRQVSAAAYRAGLVWPAAGTHPMSALQPGFGSWARPGTLGES